MLWNRALIALNGDRGAKENDKMMRWRVWVAAAVLVLPISVRAQDYPSRPVSLVVAAAAGGPIDVFTRIMAERMSPILGQSVTVENVGGGGGTLGGQRVAKVATRPCSAPSRPTPTRSSTAKSRCTTRAPISSRWR
jgi:tripartite-type tricarboxylate transporter receptor subunit TctC